MWDTLPGYLFKVSGIGLLVSNVMLAGIAWDSHSATSKFAEPTVFGALLLLTMVLTTVVCVIMSAIAFILSATAYKDNKDYQSHYAYMKRRIWSVNIGLIGSSMVALFQIFLNIS